MMIFRMIDGSVDVSSVRLFETSPGRSLNLCCCKKRPRVGMKEVRP